MLARRKREPPCRALPCSVPALAAGVAGSGACPQAPQDEGVGVQGHGRSRFGQPKRHCTCQGVLFPNSSGYRRNQSQNDSTVIRAGVDAFHHSRKVRYRRGRSSPEGFFLDSYGYGALREALRDPLSPGGSRYFRTGVFDEVSDLPIKVPDQLAPLNAVLLLDGIFLHRAELLAYWDLSIFLDVDFKVSIPRGAQRRPGHGSADPAAPENRRYVEGQKLYFRTCNPREQATLLIDNNDLCAPRMVRSCRKSPSH